MFLLSSQIDYNERLLVGYKWFDQQNIEPLFEFGYGLSYTKFNYSKLKLQTNSKESDVIIKAKVSVTNSGDVDGAEIVQAYISFPDSAGEPPKVLRGFEKLKLKKGATDEVFFDFDKVDLSIWDDESHTWTVPSGKYTIHIGASSRDIRTSASFTL